MAFSEAHYLQADACALADLVRKGEVSANELLTLALRRSQAMQERLGAISQLLEPVGRACVAGLDLTAPFAGVPFLIKDLGSPLAGALSQLGCRHLAQHAAPEQQDGDLIACFKAAGLIPFGKTTVPEFGLNLSCEPAIGPVCRNPWNSSRSSGGSSGGAAAAVAAGIVPMAHATDAAGSIRVPAAACGLVGLKPGRGAIPQGPGYNNLLGGLATELVVSRSVRDTALIWKIANQRDAVAALPTRPYRIGLLQAAPQGVAIDAEWAAAASHAATVLAQAGHNVQLLDARRLEQACALSEQAFQTYACRAAAAAALALQPDANGFEAMTWAAAKQGKTLSALDHTAAEIAVAQAEALMHAMFKEFDVILSPALAQPIHAIGALTTDGKDLGHAALQAHFAKFTALAPFAVIANAAGCAAMVLPHGLDRQGMPLSVQLMGKNDSEALLIDIAFELEATAPWPLLAPLAYA